ncbi:MAG TPA: AbrB/MazE/SpoVT family DNA-binding domain-containing protein [Thermomicrobiales bacterium]|nr:AbrB/MazE/SpoVT family DNA-binding domain-containing protein [Thermomicrobiales bacterium]
MAMTARGRVTMDARGRMTLPVEARRALHLESGTDFEIEVVDSAIVLTPAVLAPRGDAWAYTPEHRALVDRARDDAREGRIYRLGRDELARMVADADRHG